MASRDYVTVGTEEVDQEVLIVKEVIVFWVCSKKATLSLSYELYNQCFPGNAWIWVLYEACIRDYTCG